MLILVLAVFLLGFAVYMCAEAATAPAREHRLSLHRAARYGVARVRGGEAERKSFQERVIGPSVQRLSRLAQRLTPRTTRELIGARLLAAGLASRITTTQFFAVKAALGLGALAVTSVFGLAVAGAAGIVLAIPSCAFGFLLPDAYVTMKTRSRRELIRAQLPDALDVLAVSVEAGLGFDGAIAKLTEHMQGALIDEFALTLGEMRIGESRHDALKKLTERVPSPEVAAFVRAVIQADQLGISLGRILRVQAADSRLRRQAAAEEKAMKAPIKMLFPTVLFIFPAMFLVILGPAFLNLSHYL